MKKYYADKTCLNVLRVLVLVVTGSLIVLDYYFLYFIPILMWSLIGLFGLAYLLIGIIWLPLYFARASYIVSSQEVIRNTGFFFRIRQTMKVSAIQYVTLIITPFSSVTGFNFVIINALGGNLLLFYLSKTDAEEIFEEIISLLHCFSMKLYSKRKTNKIKQVLEEKE